ncbi:MAG: hypothetical protein N2749_04315 [Clostridia bacterium]|nr:hypothetical protein [Clostridia bacterium]
MSMKRKIISLILCILIASQTTSIFAANKITNDKKEVNMKSVAAKVVQKEEPPPMSIGYMYGIYPGTPIFVDISGGKVVKNSMKVIFSDNPKNKISTKYRDGYVMITFSKSGYARISVNGVNPNGNIEEFETLLVGDGYNRINTENDIDMTTGSDACGEYSSRYVRVQGKPYSVKYIDYYTHKEIKNKIEFNIAESRLYVKENARPGDKVYFTLLYKNGDTSTAVVNLMSLEKYNELYP